MKLSLHTLPAHLIFRILDDLNPADIFLSLWNVCTRLNSIINTYPPYAVDQTRGNLII